MNLGRTQLRPFLLLTAFTCRIVAGPDLPAELNAAAEAVERGEYSAAEARLLAIEKRMTAESSHSLTEGTLLLKIAAIYTAQNRLDELGSVFRRAIAIYEALPGESHNLSTVLNNLGVVCERTGNTAEAISLYSRALQVREAALGPDSAELAALLNNLGNIEREQGLYSAAGRHLERALGLSQSGGAAADATTTRIYNNLGLLFRAEDRHADAEASYRNALARDGESNSGPVLNNLGDLLRVTIYLAD